MNGISKKWDTLKTPNFKVIGIEEGTGIQPKEMNNLFNEIISKNYPNIKNEMENQIQEAYRIQNVQNCNRSTPRNIIMKMLNTKIKIEF